MTVHHNSVDEKIAILIEASRDVITKHISLVVIAIFLLTTVCLCVCRFVCHAFQLSVSGISWEFLGL